LDEVWTKETKEFLMKTQRLYIGKLEGHIPCYDSSERYGYLDCGQEMED